MKKGMAKSTKLSRALNSCWVMMCNGVEVKNTRHPRVVTPRITAMGMPKKSREKKEMQINSIIILPPRTRRY
jgi:hypothetical protein